MKRILRELTPPLIWKALEMAVGRRHQTFPSYHEALKLCTKDAYEEKELIEVIFKKTKRFAEGLKSGVIPISETAAYSLLSAINPIIESKDNKIHVLDFGGACGAHYFHLRSLIDKSIKLKWVVVETPTMVHHAKALATDELLFCDNFADALSALGRLDLLHTSCALQHVDDAQKYLSKILQCKAKWLLFNRLGLNKIDRDVVTILTSRLSNNGIGSLPEGYTDRWLKYPFIFLSEARFLKTVGEVYAVRSEDIVGYGLLCKLKNKA